MKNERGKKKSIVLYSEVYRIFVAVYGLSTRYQYSATTFMHVCTGTTYPRTRRTTRRHIVNVVHHACVLILFLKMIF